MYRNRLAWLAAAVGLALAGEASVIACDGSDQPVSDTAQQNQPTIDTVTLSPQFRDAILALAAQTNFDSVEGAGDEQRLLVGAFPGGTFGPLVRIEPATTLLPPDAAALRQGRILARLVNRDAARDYPKLAVRAGVGAVTYWYVYGDATGPLQSLYVPADLGAAVRDTVIYEDHGSDKWQQPLARWVWSDADDGTWASCTGSGCCTSGVR